MKNIAIFLVFLPAFLPMPGKAAAPPGQNSNNVQNQSQRNEKSAAPSFPFNKTSEHPVSAYKDRGQPASQDKEQSINLTRLPPITIVKEKKTLRDYLFDWGPWVFGGLLVVVGFFQLGLMWRQANIMDKQTTLSRDTLTAIHRQADLQQATMLQWVVIEKWKARYDNSNDMQTHLKVEFDISNPSSFPLTLDKFEILFRLPGCIRTSLIDPDLPPFRLCPKLPETITIFVPLGSEEASDSFRTTGLNIGVEVDVIHADMGPNKKTSLHVQGYINCRHGNTNGEAIFYSSAFRPPESDKKQKA
jgi:hypothetical protein